MQKVQCNGVDIMLLGKANQGVVPDAIFLNQCHGSVVVESPTASGEDADAIIFKRGSSSHYAIKCADCLGVVIIGKHWCAMIHAGRRSLYQGVIHATVKKLCRQGEGVSDMHVFMGPSIKYLEVGADGKNFGEIVPLQFLSPTVGLQRIDINGRATSQLVYHGVNSEYIRIHPDDTMLDNERWYSNRVEGTDNLNRIVV